MASLVIFAVVGEAQAGNPCLAAADSAQDLRKANKLGEARAALLVCAQKSCNAVIRADCEKWLREVDEQTPSLIVRAVDSRGREVLGVHITIDESPVQADGKPVQVDPGPHAVRAQAKAGLTVEEKVTAAVGEKSRVIELRFKQPLEQDGTKPTDKPTKTDKIDASDKTNKTDKGDDPPKKVDSSPSVVPYVLGGIGVVALGAFGYFEIVGHNGYSELEACNRTAARCPREEIDAVKEQFVLAGVSLGISVVAITAAVISYFALKPSSSSSGARLSPGGALVF